VKINELIQIKRKERNLTQEDLAKLLGVRPNAVSNYEKGIRKPRGPVAVKLSTILDIPLEKIIV
jgi:transcriptional regulator with XRE-family HTH domain